MVFGRWLLYASALDQGVVGAMPEVWPFVLCGGAGTRLWPLSREAFPKQFHRLVGPETLFQQTCRRLTGLLFGDLTVLSNHRHRFLIVEQLDEIGVQAPRIALEPVGRNTAPAACIAALLTAQDDPEAFVLLAPSDHMIAEASVFADAIKAGLFAARDGALVVFGVEPDCPHTGYGYVEIEALGASARGDPVAVKRFVEKPSREAAEAYLDSGRFYWNAGIFLCKASKLLDLFEMHAPEVLDACRAALAEAKSDLGFLVLGDAYASSPSISLDYAIAEKATKLACVPLRTLWSDVGSWSALWSLMEKTDAGNALQGEGEIILEDTHDSLVYSDHGCVALVGVENLVVVATEDSVLVASREEAEAVRDIVERLKGNGRANVLEHNRVYRPWGWYQSLNRGERYQVKCIMVKPGGRLSLQSHHHRSEHWVVVKGTLEVIKDEERELLSENESTFIPIGKKHRLANPGRIPALLIEVQSGAYLDEDDIVRFDDIYGRESIE
jgi:mannose-1-phosphate guanylyltransferase/mannose-6-phosphate isomerase